LQRFTSKMLQTVEIDRDSSREFSPSRAYWLHQEVVSLPTWMF
jgi:hypothetical protein